VNQDEEKILAGLDPEQREIVLHDKGPCLVAAVAGCGKTLAVTRRAAYLSKIRGVDPERIFGLTFSAKAADEMNERIAKLCDGVRVQTFHAFCRAVLVEEMQGFDRWTLDKTDRYRTLVKDALGYKHMNLEGYNLEDFISKIRLAKASAVHPGANNFERGMEAFTQRSDIVEAFRIAEGLRIEARLLTYDDWLILVHELFRDNEGVRRNWASKFDYVMVDEAQDNSLVQAWIVEALAKDHRNIMAVGDVGQSIYRFRGASPEHFVAFKDTWGARTISMHKNYRCADSMITLANTTLERMDPSMRLGDLLVGTRNTTGVVTAIGYDTQEDEADSVASQIKALHDDGVSWKDCVVLYRTNALSRALESSFISQKIPHHIVGSSCFFVRREISALVSYLRVAGGFGAVTKDFERTIYTPHKFLGKKFFACAERAIDASSESFTAMMDKAVSMMDRITKGQRQSAAGWGALMDFVRKSILDPREHNPGKIIQEIVDRTAYNSWLIKDEGRETPDNDRVSNVAELIRAATKFSTCAEFIEHVDQQIAASKKSRSEIEIQDAVKLMTCHRSKALEWPYVFFVSVNSGVIPHFRAIESVDGEEEEKRIFYVTVTRAREELRMSWVRATERRGVLIEQRRSSYVPEVYVVNRRVGIAAQGAEDPNVTSLLN
jgi:DNA helicase II / ATP-dependent DNA helicase PcrA